MVLEANTLAIGLRVPVKKNRRIEKRSGISASKQ